MAEPFNNRPLPGPIVALTALSAFSLTGLLTAGLILFLEQAAAYHCSDTLANICRASWLNDLLPIFDCEVLSPSWIARPFDAPLTLYAAAYYLLSLLLATTLTFTRANTPFRNAIEWVVVVFGATLFLVTGGLVIYSVLVFHAICRVCLLFYVLNAALCLATALLAPRRRARPTMRGQRPLQDELSRYTDRILALLLAAIALFAVSAVGRAAFLRWDHHLGSHPEESRCEFFAAPSTNGFRLNRNDKPYEGALMTFIDPACTKCRREFDDLQRWANDGTPVNIYLFPQDECDPDASDGISGVQASRTYRACAASKALWCIGTHHPNSLEAYLDRLYELQPGPVTDEDLRNEAVKIGRLTADQVTQFRNCIDAQSTLQAIALHRQIAVDVGATGTPFTALVLGDAGLELPRDPRVRETYIKYLMTKETP